MASALYPIGVVGILDGTIDLATDDIVASLHTSTYVYAATHDDMADLTGELSGTGYSRKTLTTKTIIRTNSPVRGAFDADDLLWSGINAGTAASLVISADLGADSVSPMIAYIDDGGFPIATNGGDLAVTWDAGGIFYL